MTLIEDNYNVFDQLITEIDGNTNSKNVPYVVVSQQKLTKLLSHCDLSN